MNFDGNIVERYNYDAWGRRRNPDTWEYANVPEPTLIDFGYTGHEHWDEVNIINMTGRLYDPFLARFLNADPYVSHPESSQALNRYTYVNNNPLIYNDPTGEVWQMAVYLGWKYLKTAHDNRDRETGEWDWDLETFRAKNGDWSTFFYFVGDATMNFNGGFNIEGSFNVNGVPVVGVVYEPENTGIPQSERELAEMVTNGEAPNYVNQSFTQSGYNVSWTSAEWVGLGGGFFYSMHGKVLQDNKGKWYVYASSSAWAPAAERQADAITYYSSISVLEDGEPIATKTGNLRIWDPDVSRIGQSNFTYIGDGYMPLPVSGNNISVEISITYNMYKWWNGHATPLNPYVYRIKF